MSDAEWFDAHIEYWHDTPETGDSLSGWLCIPWETYRTIRLDGPGYYTTIRRLAEQNGFKSPLAEHNNAT